MYPTRWRNWDDPAGSPRTRTEPDVMIWEPTMQRISVVLPEPDGPSSPVMVPHPTLSEIS